MVVETVGEEVEASIIAVIVRSIKEDAEVMLGEVVAVKGVVIFPIEKGVGLA